jgi:hypothetical protein
VTDPNLDTHKLDAALSVADIVSILSNGDEAEAIEPDLVSPPGLSPGAAAFWMATAKHYELRVDDWVVLELAARQMTVIDEAQAEWERQGKPFLGQGYNGQEVTHALLDLIDRAQKTLAGHLRQLKLPNDDGISPFSHAGRGQTGGLAKAANNPVPHRRTISKTKEA